MKSVRIIYKKTGDARFISHLDMNRFWARILRKADLPLWYTEGFNPHIYTRFALPLSLGFESKYEVMDVRLLDDGMPLEPLIERINKFTPNDIKVTDVFESVLEYCDITLAKYSVIFKDVPADAKDKLDNYLAQEKIMLAKKTKKGDINEFDCKPFISDVETFFENNALTLKITLPAGNTKTVNPSLIIADFIQKSDLCCDTAVTRDMLLDSNKKDFR